MKKPFNLVNCLLISVSNLKDKHLKFYYKITFLHKTFQINNLNNFLLTYSQTQNFI